MDDIESMIAAAVKKEISERARRAGKVVSRKKTASSRRNIKKAVAAIKGKRRKRVQLPLKLAYYFHMPEGGKLEKRHIKVDDKDDKKAAG